MQKINLELKINKDELKKKLDIKDGKTPSKKELVSLIESLIPKGLEAPTDEKLLGLIATLIPENNDSAKDTPEETRDKLENLQLGQKLSINAIEDLAKILEELSKFIDENKGRDLGLLKGGIHAGKGREIRFIDDETPSGTVDGNNTVFTLAKNPITGSVKVYRGGGRQRITEDYTLLGKTITFLIAPQVGEIILCDYRY